MHINHGKIKDDLNILYMEENGKRIIKYYIYFQIIYVCQK